MNNPAYMRRMVAAYVIGWSVTQNELNEYPHLEMCNTATQTGCIVSYNSQGPGATTSMARPGAIGVNPLLSLWTTSTDTAPASLNLGTVLMPPMVPVQTETAQFTGAYSQDGALILTNPPRRATHGRRESDLSPLRLRALLSQSGAERQGPDQRLPLREESVIVSGPVRVGTGLYHRRLIA